MNKTIVIVIVLLIIILGAYFLLRSPQVQAPSPSEEASQTPTSKMPVPGTNTPEMVVTQTSPSNATPSNQNIITYTNEGYAPKELKVKVGTNVTFKNNSSLSMWSASASHPTHGVYPTTGGCLGSTFDACKGVLPGSSWSFKFDIAGNWKYHDHLSPSFFGTIIVE